MTTLSPAAGSAIRSRIAGFARTLRMNGFAVGLAETRDALAAAACADISIARNLEALLRAIFCSRRSEWDRFGDLFSAYWRVSFARGEIRAVGAPQKSRLPPSLGAGAPGPQQAPTSTAPGDVDAGSAGEDAPSAREAAAARESLADADLRMLTAPADAAALDTLAARLAQRMRVRLMRRFHAQNLGRRPDLRRTLRRNIAHGGIPIELVRKRRRRHQPRLAVLLDASGSMSPYAPFFVRFVHAMCGAFRNLNAFVFHTRLVSISAVLRDHDPARAVERMSLIAQGWGGGTRIADCLRAFNTGYTRSTLGSRSAAIILSDGYDTCEPEALAEQMRLLRRRARRVFWLNPMLGWPGYEPIARGMAAALEHVDLFAPAHNLSSLSKLEPELARL